MLFNHYLRWPQQTAQTFYQKDGLHPNVRGHVSGVGSKGAQTVLIERHSECWQTSSSPTSSASFVL